MLGESVDNSSVRVRGVEQPRQPNSEGPAHRWLSDNLRAALLDRRFADGERLPTEAQLELIYSVSRQTVRRAFQDLVAEGLVYRVPGRGTFPTDFSKGGHYLRSIGTIEDLEAFTNTEIEMVQSMQLKTNEKIAGRLDLPSVVVAALEYRRLHEDLPFNRTQVYLSPELGQRLVEAGTIPDRGPATIISLLQPLLSRPIAGAKQVVTAVPMPPDAAPLFGAEPGEPCLCMERLYFDTEGNPVELAVIHSNPKRYSYRLEVRRRIT